MQNLPNDIISIIFAFDGRWRSDNGNWISVFHNKDQRYLKLHYLIQLIKHNEYICEGYNPYKHTNIYCISHIFPIINHHGLYLRFLHIKKIIVYGTSEYDNNGNNGNVNGKKGNYVKHNIIRAFITRIGCNIDMTDSYHIDDYFDDYYYENDYCFGEYID